MPDILPTPRRMSPAKARQFSMSWGYDATDDRGRRRPPRTRTMHEDRQAEDRHRRILSASARDLARNFTIAAWAIRKTLDMVSQFTFQATTSDSGFNDYLEAWWAERSKKHNFDVAGRHPHRRAVRLAEACRIVDGDVFWLKLAPPNGNPLRGKIQAIESDRVAMPRDAVPKNSKPDDWLNGVRVDANTGRSLAYAICRRVGRTRKQLQRIVSARNIIPHAAYEFRIDQVRGISPITTALNAFRDVAEGTEFALAKLKLGQLFGLQVTSAATDGTTFAGPKVNEEDADGDGTPDSAPRVDLKRGPFMAELEPGEEIKVVESHEPSSETVAFLNLTIHIAIKALDIPTSILDESKVNFFGGRGALMQYLKSCSTKILDLQEFQHEHARWRMGLAVADGELELPSGKDFDFLKFDFVNAGLPWFDPAKEARGQAMGIAMGATSPQRVCRETGTDYYENIDQIAEALAYAESKGVPLTFADSTAFAPELTVAGEGVSGGN